MNNVIIQLIQLAASAVASNIKTFSAKQQEQIHSASVELQHSIFKSIEAIRKDAGTQKRQESAKVKKVNGTKP